MTLNVILATLVVFTALAGFIDWRTGHIPNPLVLAGLVIGVLLQMTFSLLRTPSLGEGLKTAALNLVGGAVVCGLVPLLLYRFNALGGGDVKLLIAVGAFMGPILGLQVLFYSFLAAALYAPIKMLYHGRFLEIVTNSARIFINPFLPAERRRPIPRDALTSIRFGPAVFVGACIVSYASWTI